jgi:hypothetical protein
MTTSRNIISHRTGVSTFASRTSPSTGQSLQKGFHLSHADKIELIKISFPSENMYNDDMDELAGKLKFKKSLIPS